jgi:ABC-type multidrug transport system fused ATPase/permease subunit
VNVVRDVSFSVKAGQMLAIVGPAGSGKSSLLPLLRHYDVQKGCIQVNGHGIRKLNLSDLRKSIGVLGQDVYPVGETLLRTGPPLLGSSENPNSTTTGTNRIRQPITQKVT